MSYRVNALFVIYLTSLSAVLASQAALANALRTPTMSDTATERRVLMGAMTLTENSNAIAQSPGTSSAEPSESSTPDTVPDADNALLKLGSRGEPVSELQELLQGLGYYDDDPDGIFGDQTKAAVIEFQRQAELPVTGEANAVTLERLRARSNEFQAETRTNDPEANDSDAAAASSSPDEPVGEPASRQGRFWWLTALIAVSAGVGFGLYKLTRPRIQRLVSSKAAAIAPSDPTSPERSPDLNSAVSPTHVVVEPTTSEPQTANPTISLDDGATSRETNVIHPDITPLSETTRLAKIDIVDELINDLRGPDPTKRRKAIWELGQIGDSKAVQPLVDLMMDSDSGQRSLILAAISEIGVRTLKPMNRALLLSLQDHSADVRKNAIRDVTRVYDLIGQMSELLAHAASDPDVEVQETAQWALGQLGRIRNVPELGNGTNGANLPNKTPEHLSGDV